MDNHFYRCDNQHKINKAVQARQWEEEKQKEVAAHLPDDERKMPRSSVGCPGKANTLGIQSFDGIAGCKQCFISYAAAKLEALKLKEDDGRHYVNRTADGGTHDDTKTTQKEKKESMEKAMSDAAHELAEWRALGRCSKGTLARIIKSVEGAHGHGLPKGTLKPDTICKRVDRHIKDVVNEATT